jgi:glucose-1-phosphate adenylyltransferase
MGRDRILALVLAGGEGGRLGALTEDRAKPALPFGGVYRLIDFPLSNCAHSAVSDVWVLQQYQPHSLGEHIASGRPWDLDRTYGGLRVLPPYLGRSESGWYRGNADAIYRNKTEIERFTPDVLLVLSADHVYKLDYAEVVTAHRERGAEATLVTTEVARTDASRFGVVEVDGERVSGFEYKPEEPATGIVTTEVFAYEPRVLLDALDELAAASGEDGGELSDFGDELLPRLVSRGRVFEYRLEGYWRDVGTPESYWAAHMELLDPDPPLDLDEPGWPILTWTTQRTPARVRAQARVGESLLSPGCDVRGVVERSVLGPGVVVEEDAEVRESVVLGDVVVERGARVERAIVDEGFRVESGARIAGTRGEPAILSA